MSMIINFPEGGFVKIYSYKGLQPYIDPKPHDRFRDLSPDQVNFDTVHKYLDTLRSYKRVGKIPNDWKTRLCRYQNQCRSNECRFAHSASAQTAMRLFQQERKARELLKSEENFSLFSYVIPKERPKTSQTERGKPPRDS